GTGTEAGLSLPAGLAIDRNDNLYVTEWGSHRIRKATPAGVVTTVAGGIFPGYVDGPANQARFNEPDGIVGHGSGELFVTEHGNHTIRRISKDGFVSTVAGRNQAGPDDGPVQSARFFAPGGLGLDAVGNLVVADTGNHCVRLISTLAPAASIGFERALPR